MSTPKTMHALTIPTITTYIPPLPYSSLSLRTLPVPVPSPTQLLLRIHAASITPYELTWPNFFAPQPRIPCHDISGIVISAPPKCGFEAGDDVFALLDFEGQGGLAEYAVAEIRHVAKMPGAKGVGWTEAASLPRAGLTVWQAVMEHAKVERGLRVLVTGATGAVGRVGIQVVRSLVGEEGWVGAVGGKGFEGLEELGAGFVVDYREDKGWENAVGKEGKVDVVLDCVGGKEMLEKCLAVVKGKGVVVTVGSPPIVWEELSAWEDAKARGVEGKFFIVREDGKQLGEVARLVEKGVVKPSVGFVVEGLTEEGVRDGWARGLKGGVAGSVVVKIL